MDKVVLIILHTYMYVYIHECMLYYNYKKVISLRMGRASWKMVFERGWREEKDEEKRCNSIFFKMNLNNMTKCTKFMQ